MQHALNTISRLYQSFDQQVNTQKTEVMLHLYTPAPIPPRFHINGVPLKTVDNFTYLGSTLSSCCSLDTKIHTWINKASSSFGRLRSRVFENRNLKVSTKVAVYNAVCLSTLLYGAESMDSTPQFTEINMCVHVCMRVSVYCFFMLIRPIPKRCPALCQIDL